MSVSNLGSPRLRRLINISEVAVIVPGIAPSRPVNKDATFGGDRGNSRFSIARGRPHGVNRDRVRVDPPPPSACLVAQYGARARIWLRRSHLHVISCTTS